MDKSITFFYPCKSVGGAQYLLIRLIKELAINKLCEVYIIDYADGFIWERVKDMEKTTLIPYHIDESITLEDTTLVIFPGHITEISKKLSTQSNANLLVWFIQPYLLINYPRFMNFVRLFMKLRVNKIKTMLDALIKKNALVFMDEENYQINKKYFNLATSPKYLPIPTDGKQNFFSEISRDQLNVAWIGRVSPEKVESIKYVLSDIIRYNKLNPQYKINFHVIGGGESLPLLQRIAALNPETQVIFNNVLLGSDLEYYLFNNVDCIFAMGTSALDTAAYKMPTILLDYSSKKIKIKGYKYKYKWIFESAGFGLGRDLAFHKSTNKLTLEDIVVKLKKEAGNEVGEQCYAYVKNNHSIEKIAEMLLTYAKNSTFHLKDIVNFDINYSATLKFMLNFRSNLLERRRTNAN